MNPPIDLSDLTLVNPQGREVRLGEVVDRPTVIDLVRYYGCSPCRAYLAALAERHHEIDRSGGAILGVGPAAAYQAALLQERGIPFPLLLDPGHQIAHRIGLGRQSLMQFAFDVRGWWRWLESWFHGGRQGAVTAGWAELPAVVVLDAAARVTWAYRGGFVGDYPPIEETLEHLQRAIEGEVRR